MSDGEFKVYVWLQYRPDYKDGLAVAVAQSLQEAIDKVVSQSGLEYDPHEWGPVEVYAIRKSMAFCRSGGQ